MTLRPEDFDNRTRLFWALVIILGAIGFGLFLTADPAGGFDDDDDDGGTCQVQSDDDDGGTPCPTFTCT